MAGHSKPGPYEAFEANMADAHRLVLLAECLTNSRARRMRRELRERIGHALRIRDADCDALDCLQNADVFVAFLPGSRLARADLTDHRPLLRQALVAGCAATETYLADKVMTRVGALLAPEGAATERMRKLPMTVGQWLYIERRYKRRGRGLREQVVHQYVREHASTAPSRMGELLSLIGVKSWPKLVDGQRHVGSGQTEELLDRVTKRRNRIAHQGDRQGYGRAQLTVEEVQQDLAGLQSVVEALEAVIK
jgi:hypothetical protein